MKEIRNQPRFKNFNLNLILTCKIKCMLIMFKLCENFQNPNIYHVVMQHSAARNGDSA